MFSLSLFAHQVATQLSVPPSLSTLMDAGGQGAALLLATAAAIAIVLNAVAKLVKSTRDSS